MTLLSEGGMIRVAMPRNGPCLLYTGHSECDIVVAIELAVSNEVPYLHHSLGISRCAKGQPNDTGP